MSCQYKLVIFDWEGTLSDTVEDVLQLIAREAKALHLGDLDTSEARQYADLGLSMLLQKAFPQLNLKQQEELYAVVQAAVTQHAVEPCLLPGAKELVQNLSLQGVHLAIASNKGQQSLLRAMQTVGIDQWIGITRSAGQVAPKPSPEMLFEILEHFGLSAQDAVMIGDSINDIKMAKDIQMDAIGFDLTHHNVAPLTEAGARVVVHDYHQLGDFLNTH